MAVHKILGMSVTLNIKKLLNKSEEYKWIKNNLK